MKVFQGHQDKKHVIFILMTDRVDIVKDLPGMPGEVIVASIEPWSWPEFTEQRARAVGDAAVTLMHSEEWQARQTARHAGFEEPFDPKIPPKLIG